MLTKQKLKRICSKGEEEGVKESIDILTLLPYLQGLLLCLWHVGEPAHGFVCDSRV